MGTNYEQIPLDYTPTTPEELKLSSEQFYQIMKTRRSVRKFSPKNVPFEVIQNIIKTAGSAPSGANKQPWTFVVVKDQNVKSEIRVAAELEEKISYTGRMSEQWLKDLSPLGTDWHKPFLEIAPYLIVVFKQSYRIDENGEKKSNYYVNESVGIAIGMLITAIHQAGLVTLTHTPSPMNFLKQVLKRPDNEKPVLILPVGYPAEDATVPKITKKSLDEIMVVI